MCENVGCRRLQRKPEAISTAVIVWRYRRLALVAYALGQCDVLSHLHSQSAVRMKPAWEAYFGEVCIVLGVVLYLVNYLLGRNKNSQLAQGW